MIKKLLPWLLIAAGAALIFTAVFQRADTLKHQKEMIQLYEKSEARMEQQAGGQGTAAGHASDTEPVQPEAQSKQMLPAVLANPDRKESPPAADTGKSEEGPEIIGIMSIPKIKLEVAIGEGSDLETMKYMIGHFTASAKPGQPGNFAVVGHRSYRWGQFFNRLDELEKGDRILVKSGGKTYTYSVTESFTVKPEDVWVLSPTAGNDITLVTCTPIRIATHRLIVRGTLM